MGKGALGCDDIDQPAHQKKDQRERSDRFPMGEGTEEGKQSLDTGRDIGRN